MNVRHRSPFWRRVLRNLGRQLFRRAENNDDPAFSRNGEAWLLRELLAARRRSGAPGPFVVIDAGANRGDYTRHVLRAAEDAHAEAEVHAFEPAPECIAVLKRTFAADPRVRIVEAGVSDRVGEAALHAPGSSQGSLVRRVDSDADMSRRIDVPLVRLDDYLASRGIARVDLLKLDVEGWELAALRGLGASLRPEVIDFVQFEYGGAALEAGITLRELDRLLRERGYLVAKLFPSAIELRDYRPWMEHYAYANYVALHPRWARGGGAP